MGLDNHYAESKVERGKKWIVGLGLKPQDVLLVGDTAHDYIVSKHIGSDCLLIANGHYSYERLARLGVDVVSSLKEITKI
jgi:phosphoglycolate phosphatase